MSLVMPRLGQGTWGMGENPALAECETKALRLGVEHGMTLIDTAEMYGQGQTELFLGKALAGLREQLFMVSKVYPHHASRASLVRACEQSLNRLGCEHLDLYLLHWPGSHPLIETVSGFEDLLAAGKIRSWGVSNFDVADMEQLLHSGGQGCATNQILYNVTRRGPEFDLLPWLETRGIPVMAYSPVEQGRLPERKLAQVARRHGCTIYQIALAWVLRQPGCVAIPKAGHAEHVLENVRALEIRLSAEDLAELDAAFAPPTRKVPLEML